MLCQHLGFEENTNNNIDNGSIASGEQIASGDVICYKTQRPNRETSCCIYLKPLTTASETTVQYVICGRFDKVKILHTVFSSNTCTIACTFDCRSSGACDKSCMYSTFSRMIFTFLGSFW